MDTTYDLPDWESQMRDMLGPDADDMIRRFQQIIDEQEELLEPVGSVEVCYTAEQVIDYLPQVAAWLQGEEHDPVKVHDFVWAFGMELCRLYMESDDVEWDEPSSNTIPYFFGSVDDFNGNEDDEEDDEEDDDG